MSSKRILIVDDDRDILEILGGYLKQAGFAVTEAGDGDKALAIIRKEKPDLVILDLMIPGRDGLEVTSLVRREDSICDTPIIMLTARIEDSDKIVGLELGADDYITKPFNSREVVARVKSLLRRSHIGKKKSSILEIGSIRLDLDSYELFVNGENQNITPTEFRLLQVLMDNAGYTFTREELLEKGMGYAYEGMGRALDTHIKNIRMKIESDPKKPEYIQTVYSVGYRFKGSRK